HQIQPPVSDDGAKQMSGDEPRRKAKPVPPQVTSPGRRFGTDALNDRGDGFRSVDAALQRLGDAFSRGMVRDPRRFANPERAWGGAVGDPGGEHNRMAFELPQLGRVAKR